MKKSLPIQQLRRDCDPRSLGFETTRTVPANLHIIGQARGIQAINFGLNIDSPGYNIFILGETGTGRTTAITRFILGKAQNDPVPEDWVYVYNFNEPRKPRAIQLPPGLGAALSESMAGLVGQLGKELPGAFDNQTFRDAALAIRHSQVDEHDTLVADLERRAAQLGAAIVNTPEGSRFVPAREGRPVSPEEFSAFTPEQETAWREATRQLDHEMNEMLFKSRLGERNAEENLQTLIRRVAGGVVNRLFGELSSEYAAYEEVLSYLKEAQEDVLENIALFRESNETDPNNPLPKEIVLRRYGINVFVDHSASKHAPVVVEYEPSLARLAGRVEHETLAGGISLTDFTLMRSGAIQQANGGYLVLRARDLLQEAGAWEAVKRALIGGRLRPDDPAVRGGAITKSLDPQAIELSLKVVLIGPPRLYFALYDLDEDFQAIFKVMADFELHMERTVENESEYAVFLATLCEDEGLLPFKAEAVARLIEFGSRSAGSQRKLSTRFGELANIAREANFLAARAGKDSIEAEHVLSALTDRQFRSNRLATQIRENMLKGKHLISSSGEEIGQINGLYVSQTGEYAFGQPARVTARTFVGKRGVVQIDREVEFAGPIHNKGVLILTGYLGGSYAGDVPLSLNAQITFEQNYSVIEGDSASSTELFALISSLAQVPLSQGIAVTGSVNQRGEIQAIGGVTEKVEGWFDLCQARGLDGNQGVLIPDSNVDDLMLDLNVIAAVHAGRFHVWAIHSVDEGLEALTGLTAAQIHTKAKTRLRELADIGARYE